MGALRVTWKLRWEMQLSEEGYTCWTLEDEGGRRWAWAVNAPATGWLSHVGDWGQAQDIGQIPPPVKEEMEHFGTAAQAREWAEERIAAQLQRD